MSVRGDANLISIGAAAVVGCDGAPFLVLITVLPSFVASSSRLAAARSFRRAAANDKFEAGVLIRNSSGLERVRIFSGVHVHALSASASSINPSSINPARGPQSQRKSSSADAPLCDRELEQCNLSSYCAAPQPLCSASCGGKNARKWRFHGNSCEHMPARALSESVDTPPCRTEMLASTPPQLASAQPAASVKSPPRQAG